MVVGPCTDLIETGELVEHCELGDDTPTDAQIATARNVAQTIAWTLSGRRVGVCTVVAERPGRVMSAGCSVQRLAGSSTVVCGCCARFGGGCRCPAVDEVLLGSGQVIGVDEVRIGGEVVDPAEYALVGGRRLVRDVGVRWPACQLLGHDDDAPDVLVVDYRWGQPLDDVGHYAILAFGCELLKAMLNIECRLPPGVTSVTRQGISVDVLDPFEFMQEGRTGVYEFDLWLHTVNPAGLRRASKVRTPDIVEPVRRRS